MPTYMDDNEESKEQNTERKNQNIDRMKTYQNSSKKINQSVSISKADNVKKQNTNIYIK